MVPGLRATGKPNLDACSYIHRGAAACLSWPSGHRLALLDVRGPLDEGALERRDAESDKVGKDLASWARTPEAL